jgi:hypothetical protein
VAVLSFLIPVAILGLVAWVVVGFMRLRTAEAFTLATATAFYARVLTIIGLLICLIGLGIVFKALLGFWDLAYSYASNLSYATPCMPAGVGPGCAGPPDNYWTQLRDQDLVMGLTLLVIGVFVALIHFYLTRFLTQLPGGAPTWQTRGSLLALTIPTAAAAIPSAAWGLYLMFSYFILGPAQQSQPWGDPLGSALAFVPAWLFFMRRLMRGLRPPAPPPA